MDDSNKIKKGVIASLYLYPYRKITNVILILITIILVMLSMFVFSGCQSLEGLLNLQKQIIANKELQGENSTDEKILTVSTDENTSDASQPGDVSSSDDIKNQPQNEETTAQSDTSDENADNEEIINVYYADSNGEYLIGEARTVSAKNKYVDALSEMMKDPIDGALLKLIPETTKINSVAIDGTEAKVDFSSDFVDKRFVSDSVDILLIYSVVNTLTGFDEINSVQFYINGVKLEVLGMLDLAEPLFRRADLIKNG